MLKHTHINLPFTELLIQLWILLIFLTFNLDHPQLKFFIFYTDLVWRSDLIE